MFNIGDLIFYSTHGICRIDEICEKKFLGETKNYYVMHPMSDVKLTISVPVDNDKVTMLEIISKKEAEQILEVFKLPAEEFGNTENERSESYSNILKSGNRKGISKIANTLIREKIKAKENGIKLREKDKKMLNSIQGMLFQELAFSLNTTCETIQEQVYGFVNAN